MSAPGDDKTNAAPPASFLKAEYAAGLEADQILGREVSMKSKRITNDMPRIKAPPTTTLGESVDQCVCLAWAKR